MPNEPNKGKVFKSREVHYDTKESVRAALLEIFCYLCFLTVTLLVACASYTAYMYFFHNTIESVFVTSGIKNSEHEPGVTFEDLATTADLWTFLEKNCMDNLHGEDPNEGPHRRSLVRPWWLKKIYPIMNEEEQKTRPKMLANVSRSGMKRKPRESGGNATNEETLLFMESSVVLGPPRLRQIRVEENSCHVDNIFYKYFKKCYAEYASGIEVKKGEHAGTEYHTSSDANSNWLWGILATYSGGGFIKDLTYNGEENRKIIKELKEKNWIDRGTRLVLFEFSLFNGNTDLFMNIKFIGELPPTGGVITSAYMHTLMYSSLFWSDRYFYMVMGVIFYIFVLVYTVQEIREMHSIGCGNYFSIAWNLLDFSILLLAYLTLVYNIWHPFYVHSLTQNFIGHPDKHLSLDTLCLWSMLYMNAMALCAFLVCIKVFKFISFNKSMKHFSTTLRRCSGDLLGFSIMFFIVFLAYAQLGLLLFGTEHHDFRNFKESVLTMIRMILGDFEYEALENANRVLGPLFFLSYILLVFFILLNMFLAIINDTYSSVKSEVKGGHNYLKDYLRECCNRLCRRNRPVIPPKPKPANPARNEPTAESRNQSNEQNQQLRRRESELLREYFEEITFKNDTADIIRLTARVAALEDVLERISGDMDKLIKQKDKKI